MKSPYISIVIPAYNCEKSIIPLFSSIIKSVNVNLREIELVVVDDKSNDRTVYTANRYFRKIGRRLHSYKLIALDRNGGPANARNVGVKYARGRKILFLDSDVVLGKNTLSEVVNSFKSDLDLFALTGVWSKEQKNDKFFPKFKALRDWSYWINERDPRNYYYLFSTRIAAIDRGLFLRLGGFDTTYKAALVEDMELTYRIARRYAVVFDPKAMVYHEFEDFWPIAKKYFWRSYYWSRIYRDRKRFDPVATTGKEALTTITAGAMAGFLALYVLSFLVGLSFLSEFFLITFFISFFAHLWGVRKFIIFTASEQGLIFSIKSFFVGIVLYIIILAGAVFSFASAMFRK